MSKWTERDSILTRHAGHDLRVIDARSVRCVSCSHTLLLDANREAVDIDRPATGQLTEGQRRTRELAARRAAAIAAAAPPERVRSYAQQIRDELAARRRQGVTS